MSAAVVLTGFIAVALLDSLHYRPQLPAEPGTTGPIYSPKVLSALDGLLAETSLTQREKTYSAPLATHQFTKETLGTTADGKPLRDFPRLKHAGTHLADPAADWRGDVLGRLGLGLLVGLSVALASAALIAAWLPAPGGSVCRCAFIIRGHSETPWRAMLLTWLGLCLVVGSVIALANGYHVLGTDGTGNDVLYQSLKSIRTAFVIGSLTTLAMLPPAIGFGLAAGYFKGRVDDVITYLYTTLTSIPGVLLVAACVLMMQVFIDRHPQLFDTGAARADLRLLMLCLILGLTGWAGLCRLLRAEALKLRELEYVQAARAFGVSHFTILRRHLLPNVFYLVLITLTLEFSSLVLYEAVLSYLGIGVDPTMESFGSMINQARNEMSRSPMIWWNLGSAFAFMLALVLAANLFADAVRDAFDPRSRRLRSAWLRRRPGQGVQP
ncbi:ABC transporter permease [Pseudomonas sp. D2-5]